VDRQGRPLSRDYGAHVFHRLSVRAALPHRIDPHQLRHYAAMSPLLLASGGGYPVAAGTAVDSRRRQFGSRVLSRSAPPMHAAPAIGTAP